MTTTQTAPAPESQDNQPITLCDAITVRRGAPQMCGDTAVYGETRCREHIERLKKVGR